MLAITGHDGSAGHFRLQPRTGSRQRILAAARTLLRHGSYLGFSMDQLARACDLSRQTLYNHFADRESVYRASRLELLLAFEPQLPRVRLAEASIGSLVEDALEVLATAEHVELSRSADIDAEACPWVAELYRARVERPLAAAIRACLRPSVADGSANASASGLIAMLRAAVRERSRAPLFSAGELVATFHGREMLPACAMTAQIRAGAGR